MTKWCPRVSVFTARSRGAFLAGSFDDGFLHVELLRVGAASMEILAAVASLPNNADMSRGAWRGCARPAPGAHLACTAAARAEQLGRWRSASRPRRSGSRASPVLECDENLRSRWRGAGGSDECRRRGCLPCGRGHILALRSSDLGVRAQRERWRRSVTPGPGSSPISVLRWVGEIAGHRDGGHAELGGASTARVSRAPSGDVRRSRAIGAGGR